MGKRKWALLAWKLGSNGLVVDEGVVLVSVVGGSLGVYRELRGKRNSKYKQATSYTICMTWQRKLTGL